MHTVPLMFKSGPPITNQIGEFCHNHQIMIVTSKFDRAGFYDQTPVESRINNTQNLNFIRYLQHSRVKIELDQDSVSTPVSTGHPSSFEMILQNSSHGKNITLCMGIFMICSKNIKTIKFSTKIPYFHGVHCV